MPDGPHIVKPMGHDFTGSTARCPCGTTFMEHRQFPKQCRLAVASSRGRKVGSHAETELANLRRRLGLSQLQVGEALGVSPRTIARVEQDLLGGRGRSSHFVKERMTEYLMMMKRERDDARVEAQEKREHGRT